MGILESYIWWKFDCNTNSEALVRAALKQVAFRSVCTLLITDTGIDLVEEKRKAVCKTGITGAG